VTTQERPRKRTGRRRTRWPWLALAAACAVLAAAVLPGRLFGGGRGEQLDRSVFDRQDLIYGAQIGAWDLDGGLVTTDPTAGRRVVDAGIRVIRWGVWKRFDVLGQGGDGTMTLAQFDHAVDGIRRLDAIPLIELPPVWDQQCDGAADAWNPAWLEAIVRHAGDRVQLYEFANEPDHYCGWDGARYAAEWIRTVPRLKRLARSLGFEIYVGGPATANTDPDALRTVQRFLIDVRAAYDRGGDRDVVPDFVSTHTYPNRATRPTLADVLDQVGEWGRIYDQLRAAVDQAFAGAADRQGRPLGPQIRLADSEYNFTTDPRDPRASDHAFVRRYQLAMLAMLRDHHLWLGVEFTIASHGGGALDLLGRDGSPTPLYDAFAAVSRADPSNRHR